MYTVYCHINKVNGKRYVGMTNNLRRRWSAGGSEYKPSKNENENNSFYNALKKYGWDGFEHVVLERGLSFEGACKSEISYISKFDATNNKKGYNISPGGNGGRVYREHPRNMLGKPQTEYQKQQQRAFMSNSSNNPMLNGSVVWGDTHEHPCGMKGKKHTEKHKASISKIMKAKGINCKPVLIIHPDGRKENCRSTGDAALKIGLSKPVVLKLLRTGQPFAIKVVNQYTESVRHLEGTKVEYLQDNTEVTN